MTIVIVANTVTMETITWNRYGFILARFFATQICSWFPFVKLGTLFVII